MKKILITLLILFLILPNNAKAQDLNQESQDIIKYIAEESFKISSDELLSEKGKTEELSKLIMKVTDTQWIARFVMGKYWRRATEEQKTDFIKSYTDYLLSHYIPKFKMCNNDNFKVLGAVNQNENIFFVQSKYDKEGQTARVDFRMVYKNEKLLLTDIIVEGVSFITTQRSEVSSVISQKGIDGFLEDLRNK